MTLEDDQARAQAQTHGEWIRGKQAVQSRQVRVQDRLLPLHQMRPSQPSSAAELVRGRVSWTSWRRCLIFRYDSVKDQEVALGRKDGAIDLDRDLAHETINRNWSSKPKHFVYEG